MMMISKNKTSWIALALLGVMVGITLNASRSPINKIYAPALSPDGKLQAVWFLTERAGENWTHGAILPAGSYSKRDLIMESNLVYSVERNIVLRTEWIDSTRLIIKSRGSISQEHLKRQSLGPVQIEYVTED